METQIALNRSSCCHQRHFPFFCGHDMERHKRVETEKLEFEFNTTPSYLDFSLHHLHRSCIIPTKFGSTHRTLFFWGPLPLPIYNQNVNLLSQTGENLGWKMNDRTSEKEDWIVEKDNPKEISILASLQCVTVDSPIFNPIPFPLSKWFICGSRVESLCSLPLQFPRPCSTMQQQAKIDHFYRLIWSASKILVFRCLEQVQVNCRSVNDHWSLAQ
jgi:hypothetical protein